MRQVICYTGLLASMLLTGCGQSGALQLPSDPHLDKRSQYLLYDKPAQATAVKAAESKAVPASAVSSSQPATTP